MIHSLGIELVPVDESSNPSLNHSDESALEPIPTAGLRFAPVFSPRLFDLALTLASTSAIRRQMLDAAGVSYVAIRPKVDESQVKAKLSDPVEIASKLATAKACSITRSDWVIGSDSVVAVDERTFDKPRHREEAAEHLQFFSGKIMRLTSAVALSREGRLDWAHVESAELHVRQLSHAFIDEYLEAEWPEVGYTVGVFRLEARGVQLFEKIEGDHFTILGMPLIPLLHALRQRGLLTE